MNLCVSVRTHVMNRIWWRGKYQVTCVVCRSSMLSNSGRSVAGSNRWSLTYKSWSLKEMESSGEQDRRNSQSLVIRELRCVCDCTYKRIHYLNYLVHASFRFCWHFSCICNCSVFWNSLSMVKKCVNNHLQWLPVRIFAIK